MGGSYGTGAHTRKFARNRTDHVASDEQLAKGRVIVQPAQQRIAANHHTDRVGAWIDAEGVCTFNLWAPNVDTVELRVVEPVQRVIPMQVADDGFFHLQVDDVPEGSLYYYWLGGDKQRPDPAS